MSLAGGGLSLQGGLDAYSHRDEIWCSLSWLLILHRKLAVYRISSVLTGVVGWRTPVSTEHISIPSLSWLSVLHGKLAMSTERMSMPTGDSLFLQVSLADGHPFLQNACLYLQVSLAGGGLSLQGGLDVYSYKYEIWCSLSWLSVLHPKLTVYRISPVPTGVTGLAEACLYRTHAYFCRISPVLTGVASWRTPVSIERMPIPIGMVFPLLALGSARKTDRLYRISPVPTGVASCRTPVSIECMLIPIGMVFLLLALGSARETGYLYRVSPAPTGVSGWPIPVPTERIPMPTGMVFLLAHSSAGETDRPYRISAVPTGTAFSLRSRVLSLPGRRLHRIFGFPTDMALSLSPVSTGEYGDGLSTDALIWDWGGDMHAFWWVWLSLQTRVRSIYSRYMPNG
ncbi:hypothetical protein M422DRAFT_248312 [Sphaerobolus stellatus SS14]|uniref:Uncharacterized protein n=1 Tax=Sphaerobolus stellatus (strain SS14) TaxID=990650 RepID=A0A0C9UWX0_SPHS4|nr:hypothetical protein M422DRAFT_248312 [Sphaerobolus stellatus SS14]